MCVCLVACLKLAAKCIYDALAVRVYHGSNTHNPSGSHLHWNGMAGAKCVQFTIQPGNEPVFVRGFEDSPDTWVEFKVDTTKSISNYA